ncbi:pyrophosphate--fructose-6-phosphate 1-phosphotransferase [Roseiconus lacunae]|uniref:Pyrophosphate--fructose 6-phosphate 1-phosphotransferase n=1 Tax=Roseiconus lacunae TaxID=2605694 RepID=A0ABT7PCW5_9BACT|nr:pyrophosphate--fructose-6-phosphate 1-phosphotransferase [Roseiconus lacunae]MCD0459646.1 pyrophosphate--fructose-6-phosphate 1-phosphotransferase [Roseiconus lacunae]MDM4014345.1 pyrophosphate--fructose-6-phosphate 1-phosphotransferase [Roseiconus lacunae]WRQ49659.1 pyrophosphate--fructose-6-phosphate 1-phosphotransferase [Stieleria sp. HD01]
MAVKRVGILTAGGLAPCLSSAIGALIESYTELAPEVEIICYRSGYKGLLQGDSFVVGPEVREKAAILHEHGGSPIGNSRVKLTNVADCVKRGLVSEGQDPLHVAAERLKTDQVDVLHTVGGDDTNTTAADLAAFLAENNYDLTVVGLPKTIDNDVIPIKQSLGAWTAAEEGAKYFENVVAEHNANPRMLIVHEVMGRNCGWLTAATAVEYRKRLDNLNFLPEAGLSRERKEVHGVYIPEMHFDLQQEADRLRKIMDENDCVNIFISEGAGVGTIVDEMRARGEDVPTDAFGHVKLDAVNPGKWFGKQFAEMLGAEKTLVQKSGYYSRAAAANPADIELIARCARKGVECALAGDGGVIGEDEDQGDELRAIEFERIKGGKPFDIDTPWFGELLDAIGQPKGESVATEHA